MSAPLTVAATQLGGEGILVLRRQLYIAVPAADDQHGLAGKLRGHVGHILAKCGRVLVLGADPVIQDGGAIGRSGGKLAEAHGFHPVGLMEGPGHAVNIDVPAEEEGLEVVFHSYIRFLYFPGKERSRAAPLFVPVFGWIYTARGAWCRGPRRWNGRDGALPGGGCCGFSPYAVGTAGNLGLPGRGPISWEEMGKEPRGRRFLPGTPLWWGCVGEAVLLSWYLACGLQDQRLMARPPARAGGRSGSLTGGKSGNPQVYSLPSPKGYPSTSPARPAGGRAVTGLSM